MTDSVAVNARGHHLYRAFLIAIPGVVALHAGGVMLAHRMPAFPLTSILAMQGVRSAASFGVALLALLRHRVDRDPAYYWTGVAFGAFWVSTLFGLSWWPDRGEATEALHGTGFTGLAWSDIGGWTLIGCLLAASVSLRRPGSAALAGRRWGWMVGAWLLLGALIGMVPALFENRLPPPSRPDGTLRDGAIGSAIACATLCASAAVLAARRYLRTGHTLSGHLAVALLFLVFAGLDAALAGRANVPAELAGGLLSTAAALTALFGLFRDSAGGERERTDARLRHPSDVPAHVHDPILALDPSRLARHQAILDAINRILREAITGESAAELYETCLEAAERLTNSRLSFLGEVRGEFLDNIAFRSTGATVPAIDGARHTTPLRWPIQGVHGRVIRDARAFYLNDPQCLPEAAGTPAGHPSLQAFLGVPLIDEGRVFGMVGLGDKVGGYDQGDLEVVSTLAPVIGEVMCRKRGEDAVRKWASAFEGVQELMAVWQVVRDAEGRIVEQTLLDANLTFVREARASTLEEIRGKTVKELPSQSPVSPNLAVVERALATRAILTFGWDREGRSYFTTVCPIDDDCYLATSRDITVIKQAEQALAESEKRYRTLFESMTEGFAVHEIITDEEGRPCDYRFLEINPAFESLTGLKRETVLGRRVREVLPEIEPFWIEQYGLVSLGGEPVSFERYFPPLQRWFGVLAYRPALRQFAVIFSDITKRKAAEEALREINDTLERRVAERSEEVQRLADQLRGLAVELSQAEQMERKRLARILHDHIQQLLVAARMQVGRMKSDEVPQGLRESAQAVDAVLREALDASRSLTVELSPPILHEAGLIGGLTWLAARMLERNHFQVSLSLDAAAEPESEDTRFMLYESIRELLLNALKHSGVQAAEVTLSGTADNRLVRVTVRDRGKGFDPQQLRGNRPGGMTFGLFSIQQRLAHIGGAMEIETVTGGGTTIVLTAPKGVPGLLR